MSDGSEIGKLQDATTPKGTPPGGAMQTPIQKKQTGAWWTLPLLTSGIALIASAMIVGQAEENRHIAWQKATLQMGLDHLEKQVRTNEEFLSHLGSDPNLVERIAQRQMRLVREGSAVVELKSSGQSEITSPFRLVNIPPPAAVQPYEPAPGLMTNLFGSARQRLWAYGVGSLLIATGLLMGISGLNEE